MFAICREARSKVFSFFIHNHSSCDNHVDYVSKELKKLVSTGAIAEVNRSELAVCSPLGVVCNSSGKLRLIMAFGMSPM